MSKASGTNKILLVMTVSALVISGTVYFGIREFSQISKDSRILDLENQLASMQEQITVLLEPPPVVSTSTPEELESEPEPQTDANQCDYLDCSKLDGWANSGAVFTCQENNKTCACQKQVYYDYSCSRLKEDCVYSITDTKINKYSCAEPVPQPAQYPDLIIQSPSFSPAIITEGNDVFFWATLKNQGADKAAVTQVYFKIDGVKIKEVSVAELAGGGTIIVAWNTAWPAVIGQHELEVCADGASAAAESDENNNCAKLTFSVEGKSVPQSPDLIIESASISPASSTAGQIITFSAVIKNRGEKVADSSLAQLILNSQSLGTMSVNAIEINADRTVSWQNAWTAASGAHQFEACADADSSIVESNENNNCLSTAFVVP